MENFNLFYQNVGSSSSTERHLTQEEARKEELAIRISQRYALLEEERPVIKTMAYNDKLEGKVNENALADTGSDINTMPYRIFETLGRKHMKKTDKGITMIDHTQAKAMGKLSNVLCQVGITTIIAKFLILGIPIDRDAPIMVGRGSLRTMGSLLNTSKRIFSTFDVVYHQTFRAARFDVLRIAESDSDDEEEYVIKRNKFEAPVYGPRPAPYLNYANLEDRSSAIQVVTNPGWGQGGGWGGLGGGRGGLGLGRLCDIGPEVVVYGVSGLEVIVTGVAGLLLCIGPVRRHTVHRTGWHWLGVSMFYVDAGAVHCGCGCRVDTFSDGVRLQVKLARLILGAVRVNYVNNTTREEDVRESV
ncbi:integrase, catalytic region, zinc finger, CCHC-type containing protein [Tanacetum coccineum]